MLLPNRSISKDLHWRRLQFLINAVGTDLADEIKQGARELKAKSIWKQDCAFRSALCW